MIQSNEEPFRKNHNDAETYREGYHEQLVEGQFQYCDAFCMLIAF